jgi:uncharacterized protein (TIGR01319 family)
VALSSGGRVVHVVGGGLDPTKVAALRASSPDVLLLVGGTDGGNAEVLLQSAAGLADERWAGPVVVAGNVEAQQEVADLLGPAGTPYVLADNVVPQIGVLAPASARAAIREMFLRHVIGGKHLSQRADFTAMVQGATPDIVLGAVELLARGLDEQRPGAGDVVVVDVGGATTDVYSVIEVDPEDTGLSREVVATVPASRTVEGDLGMRWSARSTIEAGGALGLLDQDEHDRLAQVAARRQGDPAFVPGDAAALAEDQELASVAIGVALRRHAGRAQVVFGPDGRVVERTGKDLREADLVVGSGGVPGTAARRPATSCCGAAATTARAGSCPRSRSRWWTSTTSWRRPGCSRRDTPRRRTGCCSACSTEGHIRCRHGHAQAPHRGHGEVPGAAAPKVR